MIFGYIKKVVTLTLIMVFIVAPIFLANPKKSEALFSPMVPTVSPNDVKENGTTILGVPLPMGLDGLAFLAANVVIAQITDSIVSWINSGFQGSPAFIQDPQGWFLETADIATGALIDELGAADFLCSPFAPIKLSIAFNYNQGFKKVYKCKLSDVINNVENFGKYTSGDFSGQGGWDSWFEITQNPSNNPYGVYLGAQLELDKRIANAVGLESQKLNWGAGFLSIQKCKTPDPRLPHGCKEYYPIETPGSVVENQLNTALHSEGNRIQVADEINEILSALANQLVKTVLTEGLSNVSAGGTTNPGSTSADFEVSCSYNSQQSIFLDPITRKTQPVVWRSNVVGGVGPTSYAWTLGGDPTAVTPPITLTNSTVEPITYSTAGQKATRVAVTKDAGNGPITKFANCSLDVLADPPLQVSSCSVNPSVVRIGQETPTWTLNATGGVLSNTASSTANQMGYCVFEWRVNTDNYTLSTPLVGNAQGSSCSISPVPRGMGGYYWQVVGSSFTNVSISSGGQSVGPVQCGPLMIVD